ncbi:class I SAM-dependent methyltransferase [Mycolicibacterium sp. S2-37]|uniref:class I SAM-dependent methyltransferase n=1 Tax=Mycolicibacterium sp. S2-37 TaxID=2810297 RepID=UPI001A94D8DA|nr:class I SAM-dependent methyltransferase [Mycolicibacterium sp. S2-37]MBO0678807.1 class I SAM-dependent methyltransferase [Mycolicibacterium sp. S2-37]
MTDKTHVDLSGSPETMLATLYAKAVDASASDSVLHDHYAADIVARIEYDWAKTGIKASNAAGVAMRSMHFDTWARQFLAVHTYAVVLHLGCGLDSRYFRLAPPAGVAWYDVDYPAVIALRERFYPRAERYQLVAASVTDPEWTASIPADKPTLILGEGLTMYLTKQDGVALFRRLVQHFASGEIQFDAFNRLGIRSQWTNTVVRRSGSKLYWAIDNPSDFLDAVPGTRLLSYVPVLESVATSKLNRPYRLMAAVMNRVPGVRTIAQFHRYAF